MIKEDLDQGLNNEGNALMKTKHEYNVSPSQCPYLIPPPLPPVEGGGFHGKWSAEARTVGYMNFQTENETFRCHSAFWITSVGYFMGWASRGGSYPRKILTVSHWKRQLSYQNPVAGTCLDRNLLVQTGGHRQRGRWFLVVTGSIHPLSWIYQVGSENLFILSLEKFRKEKSQMAI